MLGSSSSPDSLTLACRCACVPTTGQQQQYLLTSDGLLEVNRVRHAASSWLVDDAFVSGEEHNPDDDRESVLC